MLVNIGFSSKSRGYLGLSSHSLEVERAVALGYCKPGDTVIIVAADHSDERSILGEGISMRVAQVLRTSI